MVVPMRKSDPELYKDKIEVSLDGRQIFYLFFGGAAIACLLFVLGVMVGKRVEARGHVGRPATSAARDPLAALDQLDGAGHGAQLSFQRSLAGGAPPAGQVERAIAELERARGEVQHPAAAHDEPRPAVAAAPPAPEAPARKPEAKKPGPEAKKEPEAPEAKKEPEAKKAEPEPKLEAKKPEPEAKKPVIPPAADPSGKARYTLQLSSFQDKAEAEAFLTTLAAAGYSAYITTTEVEGKGTYFRVRIGNYPSYDAAMGAKADFENKVKRIAYVTKL